MESKIPSQGKKFVIVDGSSYLFRAFHALPPLATSTGIPTGAAYGVVNMLRKLLKEEKPDYIAIIFDTKSKNFRHEVYPAYKANRAEMADDLSVQIAPLQNIIRAMGLPLIAIEGIEADDVIATLAHQATQKHITTLISTGDKDLAQLVDQNVTLVNTMTGSILDEKGVFAKFGVAPHQIVDYLALIGDPVDNIPGIPKVGPKTAAKWLHEYKTLEKLINQANDIKGKIGENLRAHLSTLPLGKKLVTVLRDVPLEYNIEDLIISKQNMIKLRDLFQQLEFKSWLRELDQELPNINPSVLESHAEKGKYEILLENEQVLTWLERISKANLIAVNVKTNSEDPFQGELVGISLSMEIGEGAYIPLKHELSVAWVLGKIKPILESDTVCKVGHNLKYTMHVFARYGIIIRNPIEDTMLQSYALNSIATRHHLDKLAEFYLHYQTIPYETIAGKGAKQITFDKIEIAKAAEYAAEDAEVTLRLEKALGKKLEIEPSLEKVYRQIELPLVPVLWQMEEYGIRIDVEKLEKQGQLVLEEIKALEEQAFILAGQSFNLGSPKQLQEIFYEKLKLPVLAKTPTGAPSTAEEVLQDLSIDYELPKIILSHRTLSKLKSTYIDKLPLQVNPKTLRIHTTYHQGITATGRLSSSDPNLQNIPVRTEEGRKIRQAFIPENGYKLISADYSQIELRIMAHLSQDEGLLVAFCTGQDIHRFTASEIFNVPLEEVTSLQRRSAKAINFGLIYGMSSFGVARQLDIDRASAQAYMDRYFQRYPGIKRYMDNIREKASEIGYVETLFGRRLYLPEIRSKNIMRKRAAERTAINAPMQGTAADIIKKAMIALFDAFKDQQDIKMLMQVHDELVLEVKSDISTLDKAKRLLIECMQNTVKLSVPLEISLGVGDNWDEAH